MSKLSVIIPVFNGAATIGACLEALAASTCSHETIVVDDGSTDDTVELVRRFPAVRLIQAETNLGPSAARNRGAAAAGGDVLFFLDSDVVAPPTFLEKGLAVLDQHPDVTAAFGSYEASTTHSNTCSRYKNLLHHYTHQTGSVEAATLCSAYAFIRAEAFHALGGFDAARLWMEDIELGYRMKRAGQRILLVKDLQATHLKRYSLRGLIQSDLFARAIPWTELMLEYGTFRNDLNTKTNNILSVPVACLLPFAILVPWLWFAMAAALVWWNRGFLRYAAAFGGWWFAVKSAGLVWLIYCVSAVGAAIGIMRYARRRISEPECETA